MLRDGNLWDIFEQGFRPFPGAVILADSAYPVREWLIPCFRGDQQEGARARFNSSHKKTRVVVERTIGILKQRFRCLLGGLRFKKMETCAKVIKACAILHNLCILNGDYGEDMEDTMANDQNDELPSQQNDDQRDRRRQEILQHFTN